MNFSAVLLAGGGAVRMGRDKALLPWGNGALWEHQLATLRALVPVELLISTRSARGFENCGALLLPDEQPGLGPLAGIATALAHASTDWLVVLAVDLPEMTASYLAALLEKTRATGRGAVPKIAEYYEPLAAVYSTRSAALAAEVLAGKDRSMQHFVRAAIENGLAEAVHVSDAETRLFRNLNTPADL